VGFMARKSLSSIFQEQGQVAEILNLTYTTAE